MPSDSGDNRPPQATNNMSPHLPSKLTGALPCPRCKSTHTKFCYYNNYNLSQPRHFCKACRRYWTHGGTLRNVPVGGGTRKNSKRSRLSTSSTSTTSSSSTAASNLTHETDFLRLPSNPNPALPVLKSDSDNSNLNENNLPGADDGNFFSLLSAQQGHGVTDYGSSFGYGLCEMGLGYGGRGAWGYPGMGCINGVNGGEFTWQGVGDGNEEASGLVDGDCFSWPGLAISGQGKGLK